MNGLNGLVVKRNPLAECEALRVLVGRTERRPMISPVYEGFRFVTMRQGPENVEHFRVFGWGSTAERAMKRAVAALEVRS